MSESDKIQYKKKLAFTLIEVMLLLVVLSLVFASSTSIITRKHKLKPRRTVHGQYICYRNREDGLLHEIMYSGRSMLLNHNQALDPTFTQCSFEAPKTAPYLYVQVIGGGGAGGNANHSYTRFYTSNTYTPSATVTVSPTSGKSNSYSGIIPLEVSLEDDGLYNVIGGKTLSVDDIHKYKWEKLNFSAKAFQKILNDAGVKFFVFDTAGTAGAAGDVQVHYLDKSNYEKVAGEEDENVYHWYNSECRFSTTSGTSLGSPENCLGMLYNYNTLFPLPNGTKQKYSLLDTYCQFRYPLYKNCPILQQAYIPITKSVDCPGAPGGLGGFLISPVMPYQLGVTFEKGRKYGKKWKDSSHYNTIFDEDAPIASWEGDAYRKGKGADCLGAANNLHPDYAKFKEGTLLTTEKACGDAVPNAGCVDKDGHEIKEGYNTLIGDTNYITSKYDYKYFQNSKEVCDPPVYDDEGNVIKEEVCHTEYFTDYGNTLNKTTIKVGSGGTSTYYVSDALYFEVYPEAPYYVKPSECSQSATPGGDLDEGPFGTGSGKEAKLPYFVNSLGQVVGEGIKVCVDGECKYYTVTNSTMVPGEIIPTPAQGDPGFTISRVVNPSTGLPKFTGGSCPYDWIGTKGTDGNRNVQYPTSYGQYHYCRANFGIYTNEKNLFLETGNNETDAPKYLPCPSADEEANSGHLMALRIRVRYYRDKLSYGERGRAGEYRALFARTFGSSDLRMEPGKGGVARPVSSGSSTPAGNGESTTLGTDCIDDNINNCRSRFVARGGVGGRSYLKESSYETRYITPQEIKEYVDNPAKEPEVRYSTNYTDDSDPAKYYAGEDSEFQQVSFLSDLSIMIDDSEVLELIGKGGDGGYIKHNCWLQPQYFYYFTRGYSTSSSYMKTVPNVPTDEMPAGLENETLEDWEGYTNFSEAVIGNIDVCKANGKNFRQQYEEIPGTNGYPGAIVIMW